MDITILQEKLIGALIGLAKACENNPKTEHTDRILIKGLYATNANTSEEVVKDMIALVQEEKNKIVPNCSCCGSPCGNTSDYDVTQIWDAKEEIRSLKSLILFSIRNMAAYVYQALEAGYQEEDVNAFFYKALAIISYDLEANALRSVVLEVGQVNEKCMELLKKANITVYTTAFPVVLPSE
jgi:hydroxylamine reductase